MSSEQEIFEKRLERLQARKRYSENYEKRLTDRVLDDLSASERAAIQDVIHFAKNIDYKHPGLDSRQYFLHPLRVAALASEYATERNQDIIKCAIVHNVLEASQISHAELSESIGEDCANVVRILTIDRTKASSAEYLRAYYGRIAANHEASVVKSLDKFDNIFLLCLNPNEGVRSAYLQEIKNYVLPLAEKAVPSLHGFFGTVVQDAERIGALTGEKSIALFGADYT